MNPTLLLTAYDDAMAPIGDLTSPLMLAYANRHGMDFRCVRGFAKGSAPYWQKIWEIASALDPSNPHRTKYQRVIWMDADQIVTNPEFVPKWITGFHASLDWGVDATDDGMFSMCAFVVGAEMHSLIQSIANSYAEFRSADFPEQTAARHQYASDHVFRARMHTHPRRVFNAVPREISEDAPDPWQEGDWLCHLTHVSVEERVRVFHEIIKQVHE